MGRLQMLGLCLALGLAAVAGGWMLADVSGAAGTDVRDYSRPRLAAPAPTAHPTAAPTAASPTVAPSTPKLPSPATPSLAPSPAPSAAPSASPTAGPPFIEYTVQKGDLLYTIAKRHGVSIQDILAINQIARPDSLNVGDVIRIPTK